MTSGTSVAMGVHDEPQAMHECRKQEVDLFPSTIVCREERRQASCLEEREAKLQCELFGGNATRVIGRGRGERGEGSPSDGAVLPYFRKCRFSRQRYVTVPTPTSPDYTLEPGR